MTRNEAVYKIGIDELNSREVGGNEMVDELLGHENFEFDMADVWIATVGSSVMKNITKLFRNPKMKDLAC